MALTNIKLPKKTNTQTNSFTGASGEVTIDTDKKVIVVHDGSTAGGLPLARESYTNSAFDAANTADQKGVSAGSYANGAFAAANTKYASTGGTISGDVVITGNLTISGNTTYANTTTVNLGDNIITLNADLPQSSQPSEDAGIAIDRGTQPNSQFLWIESVGKWSANNGNTSFYIGSESDGLYANAAFYAANASVNFIALGTANSASSYANGAFEVGNTATSAAAAAFAKANTGVTNAGAASSYANSAYTHANAAFAAANTGGASADTFARVQANAAFDAANASINFIALGTANSASSYANGAFVVGNTATAAAAAAFATANSKIGSTGGTITGNLIVTGANVSLGNVANLHIYGGNTGQVLVSDSVGGLSFIDLPSSNTTVYTANTLTLTNGVYVSGSVTDTQALNDGNFYQITDGSNTGPAWIITTTFVNVVSFNRVVSNIDYTLASGHTVYFQVYNTVTSTWDNIGSYSGASGYSQYILPVLEDASYISGGTVQVRLYHSNSGSVSHVTKLDYIALELSSQGTQGPRGATGATGSTGATGNGVPTGGTTGQILAKNSGTNYDTKWTNIFDGDFTITGNLTITGTSTTLHANNLSIQDNMILLNSNNTTTNPDLGFAGNYNDGSYHHAGLFRDASDGTWKFFYNYEPEPDASPFIDTANSSFRIANLTANIITDVATIRGYDPINHANAAYAKANTAATAYITPRVVTITDGASVTINVDTTDMATQNNSQTAGTLTIAAPTGTPSNGQKLIFRLYSANTQTFSWNSAFQGSTDLALPSASSGSNKYDYMGFIWNSSNSKWQMLAKNMGY